LNKQKTPGTYWDNSGTEEITGTYWDNKKHLVNNHTNNNSHKISPGRVLGHCPGPAGFEGDGADRMQTQHPHSEHAQG